MTQEALKLALEALERFEGNKKLWPEAITAIKEALAQTQEPVVKLKTSNMLLRCHRCGCSDKLNIQIEYTTPPQRTEQEPVAWVSEDVCKGQYIDGRPRKIWWECEKGVGTAFYTTPPQRTWVGLTDEDKKQMAKEANYHWEMTAGEYAERIGQLTEAKLKEKNT